tara:strand:+ start:388 stop:768 length:381 start_codon:yes stop_codon:yes gene_type:complete
MKSAAAEHTPDDALFVAEAFTRAIEERDAAALAALYTDEALVWHSHDQQSQPKDDAVERARLWFLSLDEVSVRVVSRSRTELGFVQEHLITTRIRGASQQGSTKPICLVATVQGGRISRLNEYISV